MYNHAAGSHQETIRLGFRVKITSMIFAGAIAGICSLSCPPPASADFGINNWDAVAQCESGGNWHANTGNGFYGGLQFLPSTWKEFGGHGSAAKASREEQIRVANRVLADQGPWAWPKCGPGHVFAPTVKGWIPHPLRRLTKDAFEMIPDKSFPIKFLGH